MNTPSSISVIIPVWNRATLLSRAIKSVILQSRTPKELIIVDDGSDDGSDRIANTFLPLAESHNIHMKVHSISHSGMPGKVRNIGIELAESEWIAFLDSDDEWMQDKIKTQESYVLEQKYLWCHTRELWLRGERVISQSSQGHRREGDIFDDALKKCIIGPSTVLIHKNIFQDRGLFREDLEIAEDYELFLRILNSYPIGYMDEALVKKYDGHPYQLSHKYDYIEYFRIKALEALISDEYISYNKIHKVKKELERKKQIWEQGKTKRNVGC